MEAFLLALLPRLLPRDRTFQVHVFQGKRDLLQKLESRLRGYARWLSDDCRIVVMVDRDNDECHALKAQLEEAAGRAGLLSRSRATEYPWSTGQPRRDRRAGGVVFRRLGCGTGRLSEGIGDHSKQGALPRPRRHCGRDLGSVRANLETARLLHDRTAQGGSGASHRHSHRSGPQSFAELRPIRRRHCRGKRLKEQLTSHPSEVIPKPPRRRR